MQQDVVAVVAPLGFAEGLAERVEAAGRSGEAAQVLIPGELQRARALVAAALPEVAHGAHEGPAFPQGLCRRFQQSLGRTELALGAVGAVSPAVIRGWRLRVGLREELEQRGRHRRVQLLRCSGRVPGEHGRRWRRSGGLGGSLLWWDNAGRTRCGRGDFF